MGDEKGHPPPVQPRGRVGWLSRIQLGPVRKDEIISNFQRLLFITGSRERRLKTGGLRPPMVSFLR